jgi:hypothetical protein
MLYRPPHGGLPGRAYGRSGKASSRKAIAGLLADLAEATSDVRWSTPEKQFEAVIMLDRRLDAAIQRNAALSDASSAAQLVQGIAKFVEALASNGI